MRPIFAFAPIFLLLPYQFMEGLSRHIVTLPAALYLAIYGWLLLATVFSVTLSSTLRARVFTPAQSAAHMKLSLVLFGVLGFAAALQGSYDAYRISARRSTAAASPGLVEKVAEKRSEVNHPTL